MQKTFSILAICFLMAFGNAKASDPGNEKTLIPVKSKFESVKVYCQASTSSEVVAVLGKDETLDFFRKAVLNGGVWSIVYINGRPGYVLTSEIYDEPVQVVKSKRKKSTKTNNALLSRGNTNS